MLLFDFRFKRDPSGPIGSKLVIVNDTGRQVSLDDRVAFACAGLAGVNLFLWMRLIQLIRFVLDAGRQLTIRQIPARISERFWLVLLTIMSWNFLSF